jgi:actin-related protein 5
MNELLFECYSAPKVAYGIDSLFSYNHNGGHTGLVVSSSFTATHVIPVFDKKPLLSHATRLNWGRLQANEYLARLLSLKYPAFPGKILYPQYEDLVTEHCYIAQDYVEEMNHYLDWTGLEDRDHTIQWPFVEQVVVQKSEEELARTAEKKKEAGERLKAMAAKMRLDKLVRKEQELEYYRDLQFRIENIPNKKDIKRLLEGDDFEDEGQLNKRVRTLEESIKRSQNKDVGDIEEDIVEAPSYPLLEVPDEQLDEEGVKAKRQQRLLKANHDARARAKAEKEREKARQAEEERLDEERRITDLPGWIEERRAARQAIVQRIKDREKMKADLGNRKSLASQMRMKSIASLASDNPGKKRRRGGNPDRDDDDTFGADDGDWSVYRTIATGEGSDDEDDAEEALGTSLKAIEAQLLTHDPNFTEASTRDAQSDWTKSLVHAFLRGPWPFDPESQREQNQVHLNVERIRVPEVVFQPSIAGVDQAGIVEICADILTQRLGLDNLSGDRTGRGDAMVRDIFLTGGNTMFSGFDTRLRTDLTAYLPMGSPLNVRKAHDPIVDAWKGAAGWAKDERRSREGWITKAMYEEMGSEYIKEHDLGNAA